MAREEPAMTKEASFEAEEGGSCACSCKSAAACEGGDHKRTLLLCDAATATATANPSLVSAVAALLQHLATQNKSEGCGAPCFLSATEPLISVPDYLERLSRFFQCSRECFVLALIYIDRLLLGNSHVWLCPLNVHRLFVTSLMVAVKFADDTFYSNAYYAKVGGLPLREVNHLEATLLRMLQFRLQVLPWEFHKFLRLILTSPFNSSFRPRSICCAHKSGSSAVCTPELVADCMRSGKLLQQCGNPSSPSLVSTSYFSGSSQSVSPPSTPEGSLEVKSPAAEGEPQLQRQPSCEAAALHAFQQRAAATGYSSSNCYYPTEQLKRAADDA